MSKTQITTGRVRFSYCHIFEPQPSKDGSDPKYKVTLLIKKTDDFTLKKIKAAIAAAQEDYTERTGKKGQLKHTLHDGDGVNDSGEEFGPECKGCFVITVSSKTKPVIVDADKIPITDPAEIYSGCYGRAIINAFAYDTHGKRGISFALNGIMKLSDGEPLGGAVVTDADWDDDWQDAEGAPFDFDNDPLLG